MIASVMAGAFLRVTHVIFDLDGTLLNTEDVYTNIFTTIAERYGKRLIWKLRARCLGLPLEESMRILIKELHLPLTVEEFLDTWHHDFSKVAEEGFVDSKLKPGVEKVVRHLHKHRIPMAIATGSTRAEFEQKMRNHQGILSCFHHVVLAPEDSEVRRGKPHPDVFQVCARRFPDGPQGNSVLVFEDSPSGLEAAVGANMQVVMILDPRIDVFCSASASVLYHSMEEFEPEVFGLPPFDVPAHDIQQHFRS